MAGELGLFDRKIMFIHHSVNLAGDKSNPVHARLNGWHGFCNTIALTLGKRESGTGYVPPGSSGINHKQK